MVQCGHGRVYWGMVPGWVGGRVIPVPSTLLRGAHPDSEAGPGSPYRGLEWVVRVGGDYRVRPPTHPLPAVGARFAGGFPEQSRLLANKGEI